MKLKSVIISHPTGNVNVREVANALARAGLLERFFTCIAVFQGTILYSLSKYAPFKEFRRRSFSSTLKPYTVSRPFLELGRMASQKLGYQKPLLHEKGIFCIDKIYNDLDRNVSKNLKEVIAVYAYEDGALHSFKKAKSENIMCFYDLPSVHWRAYRQLLRQEQFQRPEWVITLKCFQDSEAKLKNKDEEIALADAIFVASNRTKETLNLYPKKLPPIFVIPYGFPEVYTNRKYRSVKNRKLKLLFVGGLSQLKGIANLFEAVKILEDQIELTVVGKKVVQKCVPLEKGLAKHTWIPTLPHEAVLALMRQQDIFVFPSLVEGYGLVVTEAMSQGTPVITTNRTCGADFICDGQNGWLTEAGNTNALVDKLKNILAQPEIISEVGIAAMKTAKSLPISMYGERLVKTIKEIIDISERGGTNF